MPKSQHPANHCLNIIKKSFSKEMLYPRGGLQSFFDIFASQKTCVFIPLVPPDIKTQYQKMICIFSKSIETFIQNPYKKEYLQYTVHYSSAPMLCLSQSLLNSCQKSLYSFPYSPFQLQLCRQNYL